MATHRNLRPRNNRPSSPIDEGPKGNTPPPSPAVALMRRVGSRSVQIDPRHKAVKGDRYAVPKSVFFDDGPSDELLFGVVVERVRGHTNIWFRGDKRGSVYPGYLEEWAEYFIYPEDYKDDDEEMWQKLEETAGLRKPPRPRKGKRAVESDESDSEYEDADEHESSEGVGGGEGVPREVETWEEDDEGDESDESPDGAPEDEDEHGVDDVLDRLTWTEAGNLSQDPRARTDSMPANIAPKFLMSDYHNADLLDWFHFWCSPGLIDEICA